MDVRDAIGQAYKNGYEAGMKDAVVHGRWIWEDFSGIGFLTLCCSECLESEGVSEEHRYCHNCGAKMELED